MAAAMAIILAAVLCAASASPFPNGSLPSKSGYLPADGGAAPLFFAFYEAGESGGRAPPILLWLEGGPGCSSMFSNYAEIGPFLVSASALRQNPFSWNTRLALLFIDSPSGAGYSPSGAGYSPSGAGYSPAGGGDAALTSSSVASSVVSALQSFYDSQPSEMRSRPFFIAGESYGGKFAAETARIILRRNSKVAVDRRVNLAGLAIGNGMVDPPVQVHYHAAQAFSFGLISAAQRRQLELLQDTAARLALEGNWSAATKARNRVLTRLKSATGLATLFNVKRKTPYSSRSFHEFLSREDVRSALGANLASDWEKCSQAVKAAMFDDVMKSSKAAVEAVVRETRVLVYEGELDLNDGVLAAEAWLRGLSWSGITAFLRADTLPWAVTGEPAGTVKSSGNLALAVVHNAGHMAPLDQRRRTQSMIHGWALHSDPLFSR